MNIKLSFMIKAPIYINKAKVDNKKTIEKNYEYPLILDKAK